MKKVHFSNINNIITIDNNKDENKTLYSYLQNKKTYMNNYAILSLAKVINDLSPNKIQLIDKEEIPIKIFSSDKPWYDDDTPYLLTKKLLHNINKLNEFILEYDNMVYRKIDSNKSASLEYFSDKFNIIVKINMVSRNISV